MCTDSLHATKHPVPTHTCISYNLHAALPSTSCHPAAAAAHLLLWGQMSPNGHRQATWAHTVPNSSASSLRRGALSDYRQHDLTEREWLHTCCAAQSREIWIWRRFSREWLIDLSPMWYQDFSLPRLWQVSWERKFPIGSERLPHFRSQP